jgi:hypothetical protein
MLPLSGFLAQCVLPPALASGARAQFAILPSQWSPPGYAWFDLHVEGKDGFSAARDLTAAVIAELGTWANYGCLEGLRIVHDCTVAEREGPLTQFQSHWATLPINELKVSVMKAVVVGSIHDDVTEVASVVRLLAMSNRVALFADVKGSWWVARPEDTVGRSGVVGIYSAETALLQIEEEMRTAVATRPVDPALD